MIVDSPVRLNDNAVDRAVPLRRFLAPIRWTRRVSRRRAEGVPKRATMRWPCIRSRRTTTVSPWMSIIAREVEFSPGDEPQIYHAVEQADYVSIVAVTPDGKLPVVRQYRPAIEGFSWELPAGLVDPGESPADTCRRELLEETGLCARAIHPLGQNSPCPGRLNNRIHNFFVEAGECIAGFEPEPGLVVTLMSPEDVVGLIMSGDFVSQLCIGTLMLAEVHGFLVLPSKDAKQRTEREAAW